ncbi:restriction endonuclease subunit S [Anaeromassilibacillus sp. D41t1_190614_C2]|uniref:restriction endonuclease subunit S n=1 Tax=Anaeromassilibacillus sp. D41t1_190614_C2 TaxID=2787078 RepID=UPI001FAD9E09|nr:restriction endonuclease subunit S [Anaeromassilibacillus sp. D41t1_190614_C2]
MMARLEEICAINMGQSPDSSTYNEDGNGLPFFQGNADFGEIYPAVRMWCSEPTKIAREKDILISVRAPIGALNIANCECCIGRGLAALTVNEDICAQEYLWHVLSGKVDELNSKGTGSTFKAINKKTLSETEIPLPPIDEQRKIAAILDKVSDLIAKRRQQLDTLDELVKARFVEMFGDVIQNTKLWPQYIFSDITTSRLGKMLDAKQQTGMCQYPYLANFNVQWFRFELDNLNEMDFNEADRIEFELRDGDLLVCEGGEIGRCAVWHNEIQPCYFQKALHRVRCKKEIVLPDYLAWWFKYNCDNKGFAAIEGAKATISHLPGAKLKALLVSVPPIEQQKQFATFVEQTGKTKITISRSLEKLETLKKALMQEYFG